MPYPTTIEDYTIIVTNNTASDVTCNYCKASVKYQQPATSSDPGDVEIFPDHDCTEMPEAETVVTLSEPVIEDSKGNVLPPTDFSQPEPVTPTPSDTSSVATNP